VSGSTAKLHERVRVLRARAAIQRWEIRQRGHAAGSWFALERLFALNSRAWILSAQEAETLVAAGYEPGRLGFRAAAENLHRSPERDSFARGRA